MAIGPRLDLRQSQSLVMTPQLQQAIKLLALSNLELEGVIAQELERNPLLDSAEVQVEQQADSRADDRTHDGPVAQASDELLAAAPGGDDVSFASPQAEEDSAADRMSEPGGDAGLSLDASGMHMSDGGAGGDAPDLENMLVAERNLADHLLEQAGAILSGGELFVAQRLIDQIDECGYLRADLLALAHQLGIDLAIVERILAVIQGFDPSGVGARDLAECLAIQAREADRYDPAMAALIANLDVLARGNMPQLKRICRVDDEDLADMIAELRGYDPKPGLRIGGDSAPPVVPDLFVSATAKGWQIELNSATLPKLLVDRSYYQLLSKGAPDKASRDWLNECLTEANWLIKALDQRQRTIIKVASEIVKQQEGFFLHGVAALKPLTLRQVAEAIEMHESTVSRVTSNKYLACARGQFELKYFFTSAIQASDGGDAVSAQAVKARIKALIDAETPKNILSDDALVTLLQGEGFDIARRTVAKYREALGLGSSVQRRRQKKIAGLG